MNDYMNIPPIICDVDDSLLCCETSGRPKLLGVELFP
jgi:hypothetical protein